MFPNPDKLRPPLLKIEDGHFGYDKTKILLHTLNFTMDMVYYEFFLFKNLIFIIFT